MRAIISYLICLSIGQSYYISSVVSIMKNERFIFNLHESNIADNRQVGHEYEITEKLTAGVVLVGSEVKSCRRGGGVQLSDGIVEIKDSECWLSNVYISEHNRCGSRDQHKPKRPRKLLLTKREILKLEQRILQSRMDVVPIRMFFSEKQFVKIELGVGKKKSLVDKRDDDIKRDSDRDIRRVMKGGDY